MCVGTVCGVWPWVSWRALERLMANRLKTCAKDGFVLQASGFQLGAREKNEIRRMISAVSPSNSEADVRCMNSFTLPKLTNVSHETTQNKNHAKFVRNPGGIRAKIHAPQKRMPTRPRNAPVSTTALASHVFMRSPSARHRWAYLLTCLQSRRNGLQAYLLRSRLACSSVDCNMIIITTLASRGGNHRTI